MEQDIHLYSVVLKRLTWVITYIREYRRKYKNKKKSWAVIKIYRKKENKKIGHRIHFPFRNALMAKIKLETPIYAVVTCSTVIYITNTFVSLYPHVPTFPNGNVRQGTISWLFMLGCNQCAGRHHIEQHSEKRVSIYPSELGSKAIA